MDIKKISAAKTPAVKANVQTPQKTQANSVFTEVNKPENINEKVTADKITNKLTDDPKIETMPYITIKSEEPDVSSKTMDINDPGFSIQIDKDPEDGDKESILDIFKKKEPTVKAKKTTTKTVETENGTKTVTVEEDVEIPVSEYIKMAKEKLEGKEQDPNVKYDFDQDSVNEALWKTADNDGDGYVDEDEYKTVLGKFLGINNIDDIDDFLKSSGILGDILGQDGDIDSNGDGILSRDEFNNSVLCHILTATEEAEEAKEADEAVTAEDEAAADAVAEGEEAKAAEGAEAVEGTETVEEAEEAAEADEANKQENPEEAQLQDSLQNDFFKLIGFFKQILEIFQKFMGNNEMADLESDVI